MKPYSNAIPSPEHSPAKPCLLDLSRSFSRIDRRVATGIDRVERAYWAEVDSREGEAWAIVRHGTNYALLDRAAAADLMRGVGRTGYVKKLTARFAPRLARKVRLLRAERGLRARATYYGSMAGLMVLVAARFSRGFEYINVGHCNLDDIFLRRIRKAGATPVRIKLHDMIPLDYPDLVRTDTPAAFRGWIKAALINADQIICNSDHTADRVMNFAAGMSVRPDCVVAHIGVSLPDFRPPDVASDQPYFVCVGTIEARKNHAFLFDVWQRLADQGGLVPKLYIVGDRGWRNEAVFDLLDRSPLMGLHIEERAGMQDKEMFSLMSGAQALLFPSHEEGYGLPAMEARALGVDVICSNIPVFRDLLSDYARLLDTEDPQCWVDVIRARTSRGAAQSAARKKAARPVPHVPTWDQHFATVFRKSTVVQAGAT